MGKLRLKNYLTPQDVLDDTSLDSSTRREAMEIYKRAKGEFDKSGMNGMSCEEYQMFCVNRFFELRAKGF